MAGSVAGTIQGEAGSNPANQFAVASTIWNRLQAGTYGSSASAIVNAPNQYVGSASPNASAQQFADAIEKGTFPQLGDPGNAVNFRTFGYVNPSNPNSPGSAMGTQGFNIGGNAFSDREGAPSANFRPPQYGGGFQFAQVPDYSGAFDGTLPSFGSGNTGYTFVDPGNGFGSGLTPGSAQDIAGNPFGEGGTMAFPAAPDFSSNGVVSIDAPNYQFGGGGIAAGGNSDLTSGLGLTGDLGSTLFQPGFGNAGVASSTGNSGAASSDFFQTLINDFWNVAQRGGLIILGIVLIAVGGYWLSSGNTKLQMVKS